MKYLCIVAALVVLGLITFLAATELLDFVLSKTLRVFLVIVEVIGGVLRLGS